MKKHIYLFIWTILSCSVLFAKQSLPAQVNATDPECEDPYAVFVYFHLDRDTLGIFSVTDTTQVHIASGNLQYNAVLDSWRFALNQFDFVGDSILAGTAASSGNVSMYGVLCNNQLIKKGYAGWIDLFGWGTSGFHNSDDPYNINFVPYRNTATLVNSTYNAYGYGPSTTPPTLVNIDTLDVINKNYDWGQYNYIREYSLERRRHGKPISTKLDSTMYGKRTWRVPTQKEIDYMLNTRKVGDGTRIAYTLASIHYDAINPDIESQGLIIFPDSFKCENVGDNSLTLHRTPTTFITVSRELWRKLDSVGCAFLPAAGRRTQTSIYYNNNNPSTAEAARLFGCYWLTDAESSSDAKCFTFRTGDLNTTVTTQRYRGCAVRLVQDAKRRKK